MFTVGICIGRLSFDFTITTIIKIIKIEKHTLPENEIQIDVVCKALDSDSNVFDLMIVYFFKNENENNDTIKNLRINKYYIVEGAYGVCQKEPACIIIDNPKINNVKAEYIKHLDIAFEIND